MVVSWKTASTNSQLNLLNNKIKDSKLGDWVHTRGSVVQKISKIVPGGLPWPIPIVET